MYSSEKEYVPFLEVFDMSGQAVENYLQALVEHQCKTLKDVLQVCCPSNAVTRNDLSLVKQEAMATYVADKRHEWQFVHCCQIVLVTTMIFWASEVTSAFGQLEDGNETAIKDQWQTQVDALKHLTHLVCGQLEKQDRKKIVS